MTADLRGHVALVTGGSKGIGLAIAEALLAEGMQVVITGRGEEALAQARGRLGATSSGGVTTFALDVGDGARVGQMMSAVVQRFGGLDVVVNNAGIGTFTNVSDMTPEQWHGVIGTNLTGVFNVCRSALPELRRRGGGYIINISSLAGKNPFVGGAAYCASKAGLNAFSEALMQEVRHDNIKVSVIAPGSVATGFTGDPSSGAQWKIAPSDVGDVVLTLLRMDPRSLPSYIELRPSKPPKK